MADNDFLGGASKPGTQAEPLQVVGSENLAPTPSPYAISLEEATRRIGGKNTLSPSEAAKRIGGPPKPLSLRQAADLLEVRSSPGYSLLAKRTTADLANDPEFSPTAVATEFPELLKDPDVVEKLALAHSMKKARGVDLGRVAWNAIEGSPAAFTELIQSTVVDLPKNIAALASPLSTEQERKAAALKLQAGMELAVNENVLIAGMSKQRVSELIDIASALPGVGAYGWTAEKFNSLRERLGGAAKKDASPTARFFNELAQFENLRAITRGEGAVSGKVVIPTSPLAMIGSLATAAGKASAGEGSTAAEAVGLQVEKDGKSPIEQLKEEGVVVDEAFMEEIDRLSNVVDPLNILPGVGGAMEIVTGTGKVLARTTGLRSAAATAKSIAKMVSARRAAGAVVRGAGSVAESVGKQASGGFGRAGVAGGLATGVLTGGVTIPAALGTMAATQIAGPAARAVGGWMKRLGVDIAKDSPKSTAGKLIAGSIDLGTGTVKGALDGAVAVAPLVLLLDDQDMAEQVASYGLAGGVVGRGAAAGIAKTRSGAQTALTKAAASVYSAIDRAEVASAPYGKDSTLDTAHEAETAKVKNRDPKMGRAVNFLREALRPLGVEFYFQSNEGLRTRLYGSKPASGPDGRPQAPQGWFVGAPVQNPDGTTSTRIFLNSDGSSVRTPHHEAAHALAATAKVLAPDLYNKAITDVVRTYGSDKIEGLRQTYSALLYGIDPQTGQPRQQFPLDRFLEEELVAEGLANVLQGRTLSGKSQGFMKSLLRMVGRVGEQAGLYRPQTIGGAVSEVPGIFGQSPSFEAQRAFEDLFDTVFPEVRVGDPTSATPSPGASPGVGGGATVGTAPVSPTPVTPTAPAQVAPATPSAVGSAPVGLTGSVSPTSPPVPPARVAPGAAPTAPDAGPKTAENLRLTLDQRRAVNQPLDLYGSWREVDALIQTTPGITPEVKATWDKIFEERAKYANQDMPPMEILYKAVTPEADTRRPPRRSGRRADQAEAYIKEALGALPDDTRTLFQKQSSFYNVVLRRNPDGSLNLNFWAFSPDKVFSNAILSTKLLASAGALDMLPYQISYDGLTLDQIKDGQVWTPEALQELSQDINTYVSNQAKGFTGEGKRFDRTAARDAGFADYLPPERGNPTALSKEKADYINLLMGLAPPLTAVSRGAQARSIPANIMARILAESQSRPVAESRMANTELFKSGKRKGEPKNVFRAADFPGLLTQDIEIGEPNLFRETLIDRGVSADDIRNTLTEAIEEISIEHIDSVRTAPESGVRGVPSISAVRSGFQPAQGPNRKEADEGWNAHDEGEPIASNPYPDGTPEAKKWDMGWLERDYDISNPRFQPARADTDRTGLAFKEFFSKVTRGEFGASAVPFTPIMDIGNAEPFLAELANHSGNFDEHIAKSIPGYKEMTVRKGHAIAEAFKDGAAMLDIAASEGSMAKTVTARSDGKITSVSLDPNPDMAEFFRSKSRVEGAAFVEEAFLEGFEDNGKRVPAYNPEERFDVVNESMGFQFINPDRPAQIAEVKRLMKPDGIFVTEEKLKNPDWAENERKKDTEFKEKYFSKADLSAKDKVVGFQQSKQEAKAVGMVDNMVTQSDYEATLKENFKHVVQYWDSGNFKGYVAGDDLNTVMRFVSQAGDLSTDFSTGKTPRVVEETGSAMPSAEAEAALTMPPDELYKFYRKHGGQTQASIEVAKVFGPARAEEVKARLEETGAAAKESLEAWKKDTKNAALMETAMALAMKSQFLREAYEAITDTGSMKTAREQGRAQPSAPPESKVQQRLFHGSQNPPVDFQRAREGSVSTFLGTEKVTRVGVFATDSPQAANRYAGDRGSANVRPVYMDLRRPLDLREGLSVEDEARLSKVRPQLVDYIASLTDTWEMFDETTDRLGEVLHDPLEWVKDLRRAGFDGVIFKERDPETLEDFTSFVAFEPGQVYSAVREGRAQPSISRDEIKAAIAKIEKSLPAHFKLITGAPELEATPGNIARLESFVESELSLAIHTSKPVASGDTNYSIRRVGSRGVSEYGATPEAARQKALSAIMSPLIRDFRRVVAEPGGLEARVAEVASVRDPKTGELNRADVEFYDSVNYVIGDLRSDMSGSDPRVLELDWDRIASDALREFQANREGDTGTSAAKDRLALLALKRLNERFPKAEIDWASAPLTSVDFDAMKKAAGKNNSDFLTADEARDTDRVMDSAWIFRDGSGVYADQSWGYHDDTFNGYAEIAGFEGSPLKLQQSTGAMRLSNVSSHAYTRDYGSALGVSLAIKPSPQQVSHLFDRLSATSPNLDRTPDLFRQYFGQTQVDIVDGNGNVVLSQSFQNSTVDNGKLRRFLRDPIAFSKEATGEQGRAQPAAPGFGIPKRARTDAGKDLEALGINFISEQQPIVGLNLMMAYDKNGRVGELRYWFDDEAKNSGIMDAWVREDQRGKGIGEALYREVATILQDNGIVDVHGSVIDEQGRPQKIRERVFGNVRETKEFAGMGVEGREVRSVNRSVVDVVSTIDPLAQFQPSSDPRAVKVAAIRFEDGATFTGLQHFFAYAEAEGYGRRPYDKGVTVEEGFLTNEGEFLNREEAAARAVEMGQVDPDDVEADDGPAFLVSEDVRFQPARTDFAKRVAKENKLRFKLLDVEESDGAHVFELEVFRPLDALMQGKIGERVDGNRDFDAIGEGGFPVTEIGQPAKVGGIRYSVDEDWSNATVDIVRVEPMFERLGIGEALYREAAAHLQSEGVRRVFGDVVDPVGRPQKIRERVFGQALTAVSDKPSQMGGQYVVSQIDPLRKFLPSPDPRAIKAAAINVPEGATVDGEPIPAGISEGVFHAIAAMALGVDPTALPPQWFGFVTNEGEFLTREQAFDRALELKQVAANSETAQTRDSLESGLFDEERRFQPATAEAFLGTEDDVRAELSKDGWAIITATQEAIGDDQHPDNVAANAQLRSELAAIGADVIELEGKYKGVDQGTSFLVIGPTEERIRALGKKYNQESILTSRGLVHANDDTLVPVAGAPLIGQAATSQDFYSELPNGIAFSTPLNFEARQPLPGNALPRKMFSVEKVPAMWILPNGEVVNAGSLHERYLAENADALNKRFKTDFSKTEDVNERNKALRAGFVRVRYRPQSGDLVIEMGPGSFHKHRAVLETLLLKNAKSADRIGLSVVDTRNDKIRVRLSDDVKLFTADDPVKEALTFLDSLSDRPGSFQPARPIKLANLGPEEAARRLAKESAPETLNYYRVMVTATSEATGTDLFGATGESKTSPEWILAKNKTEAKNVVRLRALARGGQVTVGTPEMHSSFDLPYLSGRKVEGVPEVSARKFPATLTQEQLAQRYDRLFESVDKAAAFADKLPNQGYSVAEWGATMSVALNGSKGTIPPSPLRLLEWLQDPATFRDFIQRADPAIVAAAVDGLNSLRPVQERSKTSGIPVEMVALHFTWGLLSRMLDPVNQEAGWIRLTSNPEFNRQLANSIDGKYDLTEAQWKNLVRESMTDTTGVPTGRAATANSNKIHQLLAGWNGRWKELASIINSPELTGPQMRREYFKRGFAQSSGIQHKVLSFVLATLARDDMFILDRWQAVSMWFPHVKEAARRRAEAGAGSPEPIAKLSDGTPEDTTGAYDILAKNAGLSMPTVAEAVYTMIERGLQRILGANRDWLTELLGREPTVFDLHWITWNIIKEEGVGHSSLEATAKALDEGGIYGTKEFPERFADIPKRTEGRGTLAGQPIWQVFRGRRGEAPTLERRPYGGTPAAASALGEQAVLPLR